VNVTQRLAAFAVSAAVPEEARESASRALLDTLGVALAGARTEAARIIAGSIREQGGAPEATVLGADFRAPAAEAALANGVAAHALDFDDVSATMRGHPSVPLVPALFALGEARAAAGRDVLDAFVVGFEIECKLGRVIGGPAYTLGWHATSVFGTVGAAAACARLLGLSVKQTASALAIAASLAGGLQANFGTMTKPLHAGWAARSGLTAAALAGRGLSAATGAIEVGFLRAFSGGAEIDPRPLIDALGNPWEILDPGIGVKLYPCCYATHRAIDAALDLRNRHRLTPDQIEEVTVCVSRGTLVPLIRRPPESALEAKFSMEYCVAAALLDGRVDLDTFTEEAIRRRNVASLAGRIHAEETEREMDFPIEGEAEVTVRLKGGGSLSVKVEVPRGDPRRPLTWDELTAKFHECVGGPVPEAVVDELVESFRNLDEIRDVGALMRLLRVSA
jgi:2-methylcitrate dehydratase PrpD